MASEKLYLIGEKDGKMVIVTGVQGDFAYMAQRTGGNEIMIKGQKLIYGANDKAHSIECTYTGEYRITSDGNIVISATCEGGTITAPIEMFTRI